MALQRKTPLRAKTGFKPSQGFKRKPPKPREKAPVERKRRQGTARSSLTTHLDIVFSLYIRLRDAMEGGRTRCISCGRVFPFGQMQCGHYFTRHNMSVRWDEDNCSSQCVECNCVRSGNIGGYTQGLAAKIGRERLDALSVRAHGTRKWSGEELRELIKHYELEIKRLSKEKGISVRI